MISWRADVILFVEKSKSLELLKKKACLKEIIETNVNNKGL